MSRRGWTRNGGLPVKAVRIVACTAGAIFAALFSAGIGHAAEAGFLDAWSRHGYGVSAASGQCLLGSGEAMCGELRAGHSPDYVAKHWTYPNASYQNLLDMATAAQNNLCGGD